MSSKEMAETRKGSLTDVGQSELRRHALDEIPHFRWGGLCTKDVQEVCNQTGDMWGGHRRSGDGVSSAAGPGGGNVRSGGKDGDGWSIVRVPRHAIGDICCANGNCPGGVGRAGVASILVGITLENCSASGMHLKSPRQLTAATVQWIPSEINYDHGEL